MSQFRHITVLLDEAVAALQPRSDGRFVDLTAGGAGHSAAIAAACAPDGKLLAFDRDPIAVGVARERLAAFGDRVEVVHSPFDQAPAVLAERGWDRASSGGVDGILADLGVSSPQLDEPTRGFSLASDGPLDMRMSDVGMTAGELIDASDADALADIFYHYGEIRESRRLARAVKADREAGKLETTKDLAGLCARVLGRGKRKIDPATLPFQALRIAVNGELDQLDALLNALPDLVADGGRVAIIAFHSLEDRRVKQAFRALSSGPKIPRGIPVRASDSDIQWRLVGGAVKPSDDETSANPRARSARLRVIERLPTPAAP